MKRTLPVVRWASGKSRLLKHILPLIPPHTTYVEPFGGGLAVFLAKPRSPVEVVNDLNRDLVGLYRCAQWHLEALVAEIEWTLQARANVLEFRDQAGLTDLQRAARFLLRNRGSFGGGGDSFAVQKASPAPSRANVLALLRALNARLDKVSVENLSYERCLELYDSPASFFFLDPPYVGSDAKLYTGWSAEEVRAFAARVRELKGRWLVTLGDCPEVRAAFAGCLIQSVTTQNGSVNRRLQPDATFAEVLIRPRAGRAVAVALPVAA